MHSWNAEKSTIAALIPDVNDQSDLIPSTRTWGCKNQQVNVPIYSWYIHKQNWVNGGDVKDIFKEYVTGDSSWDANIILLECQDFLQQNGSQQLGCH